MTISRVLLTAATLAVTLLASGSALAQWHSHGHGPHVGIGIHFGIPLYGGYYPYAPYPYYYPPVVVQSAPQVYVEQPQPQYQAAPAQPQYQQAPAPQAQAPASADWFYCNESKTYYPYVKECTGPWQRVPAQPQQR